MRLGTRVATAGLIAGLVVGCATGDKPSSEVPDGGAATRAATRVESHGPVRLGDGEGTITGMAAARRGAWAVGVDSSGRGSAWRVDGSSGTVTESVRLPGAQDVAVGAGAVWIVAAGPRRAGWPQVLVRVDPDDGEVVARSRIAPRPGEARAAVQGIAAGPSGVWVTLRYGRRAGDIVRIDPRTGEIAARVDARGAPGDIALADDSVWFVSNARRGLGRVSLHRLDARTDEIVASPVRQRLHHTGGSELLPGFAIGEDEVWASSFENGRQHALRVDTTTNDVAVAPLALKHFAPVAVTADGVWFIGRGGLAQLDIDTLEADRPIELPIAPTDADVDPAGDSLWLAGYHAAIVRVELP